MKLRVHNVFTAVEADYIEQQTLYDLLTIINDKDEKDCLLIDHRGQTYFYTGLLNRVVEKIPCEIIDEREPDSLDLTTLTDYIEHFEILPGVTLREYQKTSVVKCLLNKRGVVNIATGGGKTEVIAALLKILGLPALVVTTGIKSMYQIHSRLEKYGLEAGMFWGEEQDLSKSIVVGVSDSLSKHARRKTGPLGKFVEHCRILILDECHHLPTKEWTTIAEATNADFRYGFSASPYTNQDDFTFNDYLLTGLTGELIVKVPAWVLVQEGYLATPLVSMVNVRYPGLNQASNNWTYVYRQGIVRNTYRNKIAASIAEQLKEQGFKVLVLVVQIEHGVKILELLNDPDVKFSYGGGAVARWSKGKVHHDKEDTDVTLKDLLDMKQGIFVGSTVFDEAIDVPDVSALIVLSGTKRYRRAVQRIGRALRPKPGTNEVLVFDFYDNIHWILKNHSRARIKVYEHDDFRYTVSYGLDAVNSKLKTPLIVDTDSYTSLMKSS